MQLAWILREKCGDFLAHEGALEVADLEIALNRVVIGDGHEIHSGRAQLLIKIARLRTAVGKIEAPEKPFLRARAEARVKMKIAATHEKFN